MDQDDLFFGNTDLDRVRVQSLVDDALLGADDGELFLEHCTKETLSFDDGKLKTANFDTLQGFGLRAVAGEATGFAHSSELSESAMRRAATAIGAAKSGHDGNWADSPPRTNGALYTDDNPLQSIRFAEKMKLMAEINAYGRNLDPRVRQVTVDLLLQWQAIEIIRPGGEIIRDVRPLVRFEVGIVAGTGDLQEQSSYTVGGRKGFEHFCKPEIWQKNIKHACASAAQKLRAGPAPAGEMDVVIGPGWPGVLLHEAVGHGLEGDFNRKKTSAFSGLVGERVASPGVTIVDDGSIAHRRGSLTVDDEGTPTRETVLIEDGVLKGYMQDRLNARLMGVEPTGNGRRESYAHRPFPRMTNTIMRGGDHDPGEIIASVKDGIYTTNFGGGAVDITSGKFVFDCIEAFRIENGKVAEPVKGVMIAGNGPDALTKVKMLGNDFEMDTGRGRCHKEDQWITIGVGQPTVLMGGLTVGGTGG